MAAMKTGSITLMARKRDSKISPLVINSVAFAVDVFIDSAVGRRGSGVVEVHARMCCPKVFY